MVKKECKPFCQVTILWPNFATSSDYFWFMVDGPITECVDFCVISSTKILPLHFATSGMHSFADSQLRLVTKVTF